MNYRERIEYLDALTGYTEKEGDDAEKVCTCATDAEHLDYLRIVRSPYTKPGWRRFMEGIHNG